MIYLTVQQVLFLHIPACLRECTGVAHCHPHTFRRTMGRPFGRLVNTSLDVARHQGWAFSPWRVEAPSSFGPFSFQGT